MRFLDLNRCNAVEMKLHIKNITQDNHNPIMVFHRSKLKNKLKDATINLLSEELKPLS